MPSEFRGTFHKLFCALRQQLASHALLLLHKKFLKSWAEGMNSLALGAIQFMKSTPGHFRLALAIWITNIQDAGN